MWHVYELIDPRSGEAFYVGCSTKPLQRLAAHGSDRASSAWDRIKEIKGAKLRPELRILASFNNKAAALWHEHEAILNGVGLENAGFSLKCPIGCDCLKHNPTPFLNNEGWTAEFMSKGDALRASRFLSQNSAGNNGRSKTEPQAV